MNPRHVAMLTVLTVGLTCMAAEPPVPDDGAENPATPSEAAAAAQQPIQPRLRALRLPVLDEQAEPPVIAAFLMPGSVRRVGVDVIVAVWNDGSLVWSADPIRGGPPYRKGSVGKERIEGFLDALRRKAVWAVPDVNEPYVGFDAGYTVLAVRDGPFSFNMQSWHELNEHHSPGVAATSNALTMLGERTREEVLAEQPETYRRYRDIWADVKKTMIALIPDDAQGDPFETVFQTNRIYID